MSKALARVGDDVVTLAPVVLDAADSNLRLSVTFRIDAETCVPTLETAEPGYALMPGRTPLERSQVELSTESG